LCNVLLNPRYLDHSKNVGLINVCLALIYLPLELLYRIMIILQYNLNKTSVPRLME